MSKKFDQKYKIGSFKNRNYRKSIEINKKSQDQKKQYAVINHLLNA